MAEVLVYRGTGVNGTANFGHLLGTNYTFEIGDIDADMNEEELDVSRSTPGFQL